MRMLSSSLTSEQKACAEIEKKISQQRSTSDGPSYGAHLVDQVLTATSQTEPPATVLGPLVAHLLQVLKPLVEARQSGRRAVLQTFRQSVRLDCESLDGVARNLRCSSSRQFLVKRRACWLQVLDAPRA